MNRRLQVAADQDCLMPSQAAAASKRSDPQLSVDNRLQRGVRVQHVVDQPRPGNCMRQTHSSRYLNRNSALEILASGAEEGSRRTRNNVWRSKSGKLYMPWFLNH